MTVEETPVAVAAVKKGSVPRPDETAFNKTVADLMDKITDAKTKLEAINVKLSASDSIKATFTPKKDELQAKLTAANKEKEALSKERNALFDRIKELQANMKKKNDQVKASQDKLGFKSAAEIDQRIASYEQQLSAGRLSLQEEKKMVADISALNKAKKSLESFSTQRSGIDSDKSTLETLRTQIEPMNAKRDELNASSKLIKDELDKLYGDMKGKTGKFSALYAEKTALRKELDVLNDQSRAVKSAHYKAKDEFRAHMQVENARRQEEYKARIALEKTEKMRVVAERELEAASIPAFADELSVCNALTLCLSTYLPDYKPPVATPATAEKTSSTPGRAVDTTLPAGAVVIKKKSEREDEGSLIVGKKKKGSTQPGPKKVIPLTPAVKALKLDLEMIEQFAKLKIDIPVSSAEVPKTLEAIEAKKKFFLENQAAKTLEAQEKARLKIDEIQKKLDAGEEEPAVEVVAA